MTSAGAGEPAPLSQARPAVPLDLYEPLALLLGEDTPGFLRPGQSFTGVVSYSDWPELAGARVRVEHSSWFTGDIPGLLAEGGPAEAPVLGLAWGTFEITGGPEDYYQGTYSMVLGGPSGGALVLDSSCNVSHPVSAAVSGLLERPVEIRAAIVDLVNTGDFITGPRPATGVFRKIGDGGTVAVSAHGCLEGENAGFSVISVRARD